MLNEELKDQILNTKLTFLNGYLMALGLLNSYAVIGLNCKLFAFNFSAGDIEKSVQDNSYELFGVYPNSYQIEVRQIDNWENRLTLELNASIKKRISTETSEYAKLFDYSENDLVKNLSRQTKIVNDYFVKMLKDEFGLDTTNIYELLVKGKSNSSYCPYRLFGLDLIFEIGDTKIILLQICGND